MADWIESLFSSSKCGVRLRVWSKYYLKIQCLRKSISTIFNYLTYQAATSTHPIVKSNNDPNIFISTYFAISRKKSHAACTEFLGPFVLRARLVTSLFSIPDRVRIFPFCRIKLCSSCFKRLNSD